ncbi:hypothetical protein ACFCV3_41770 [Kribbella sp. NPDC056345]|uniref:hypothetical protein n=1 Tax=Kribbella sp. NPDC056345 TaxID=3345789 RepID=UPI0035D82CBB
MSIKPYVCITIECERCGTDWWEADGEQYVIHFDTTAEALAYIAEHEWRSQDGHHWCPSCVAALECERDGHQLTPWQTCNCLNRWKYLGGSRPVEEAQYCGHLWRHCTHCLKAPERVTLTDAGVCS